MEARRLVWDSLLSADYRARYYGHLAGAMEVRDETLAIVVAIASSSTFVAVVSKLPWSASAIISLLSAGLGIFLTVKKFGKLAETSAAMHKGWSSIENDFEMLWCQVDSLSQEELLKRWRQIKAREEKLEERIAMKFRLYEDLTEKAKQEVFMARKLSAA
jgi:hypothetical protein